MTSSQIICVTGITGKQGGAVACELSKAKFKVRGFVRNLDSEEAKKLLKKGIELVEGNLHDKESVKKFLDQAYGAFLVTDFFDYQCQDVKKEESEAHKFFDAAKEASLEHVIFSSLESALEKSSGKFNVPPFDGKFKAEEYLKKIGLGHSIVRMPPYYENFLTYFDMCFQKPAGKDNADWRMIIPMGDGKMSGMSVYDLGAVCAAVFKEPSKFNGKVLPLAVEHAPLNTYAEILSKVVGKKIEYKPMSKEEYAKQDFQNASEMAEMFAFLSELPPDHDVALTKELNPNAMTFNDWAQQHSEDFKKKFC